MNKITIKGLLKKWNLSKVDIHQYKAHKDTGSSFYNKNGIFTIIINPTNHFSEWVSNFMAWTHTSTFGSSYGYAKASAKFYKQIVKDYNGTSTIELIGASRGGAIAIDLYLRFQLKFPNVKITVTTFGCPPVGTAKFIKNCKLVKMNHIRVVDENDCVPTKPRWRKHYQSDLVFLKNNLREETPWYKRKLYLCKKAHLDYGTQLQKLLNAD